jgi:hypothetical protein
MIRCVFVRRIQFHEQGVLTGLIPLSVYLSVTIFVPFLNHAHQIHGRQFWTHSLWVAGVGIGFYGLIMGVRLGYVKIMNSEVRINYKIESGMIKK